MANYIVEEPPALASLAKRLGSRLRSYRELLRGTPVAEQGTPELAEIYPLWEIPVGYTLEDELLLESFGRWHAQVFLDGEPRFYARCAFEAQRDRWRVDWIGEKWLAEDINQGAEALEGLQSELTEDSSVRLVSSRRFKFSAFWLVEPDRFLIASARSSRQLSGLFLDRADLRAALIAEDGLDSASFQTGGLGSAVSSSGIEQ